MKFWRVIIYAFTTLAGWRPPGLAVVIASGSGSGANRCGSGSFGFAVTATVSLGLGESSSSHCLALPRPLLGPRRGSWILLTPPRSPRFPLPLALAGAHCLCWLRLTLAPSLSGSCWLLQDLTALTGSCCISLALTARVLASCPRLLLVH